MGNGQIDGMKLSDGHVSSIRTRPQQGCCGKARRSVAPTRLGTRRFPPWHWAPGVPSVFATLGPLWLEPQEKRGVHCHNRPARSSFLQPITCKLSQAGSHGTHTTIMAPRIPFPRPALRAHWQSLFLRPTRRTFASKPPNPTVRRPFLFSRSINNQANGTSSQSEFYKTFTRPVAKVLLIAVLTYQIVYWSWVKLETDEIRAETDGEFPTLCEGG